MRRRGVDRGARRRQPRGGRGDPEDVAAAAGPQDLDIEISEEQAFAAAEGFVGCDLSFGEAFVGQDGPEEGIDCINDVLSRDEDLLVEGYTAQYLGDSAGSDEIFSGLFATLQQECGEFLGN